jgi:hypothetical protein
MNLRILLLLSPLVLVDCVCGPEVADEESAERAYLGLDTAVERMLALGFAGFNAADSANIPEQRDDGDEQGEMVVNGQVDQGASDNKGMRLDVDLIDYADEAIEDEDGNPVEVVYDTNDAPLVVDLSLRDIPDGTFDGTLAGTVTMEGDLEGDVTLTVAFDGALEAVGDGTARKEGSTAVTGTAESPYGTYDIDLTR